MTFKKKNILPKKSNQTKISFKPFPDEKPIIFESTLDLTNLNKPLVSEEEAQIIKDFFQSETEKKAWIQTYTGKKFYPLNPKMEDICIEDIAHALSMICRFNGHSLFHYSVAQHSVGVSYLVPKHLRLMGLLHDNSEAFLNDCPSPVKRTDKLKGYREVENNLQSMIYRKFGLPEKEDPEVKHADLVMLSTEARDLLGPLHPEWKLPTEPLPFKIIKMSPEEAKKLFLDRFDELMLEHTIK